MSKHKETIQPTNRVRISQIADWIKEENRMFIQNTNTVIKSNSVKEGFRYFVNNIEKSINTTIMYYVLDNSFRRYGKVEVCRPLFFNIFSKRITNKTKEEISRSRVPTEKLVKQEESHIKSYKKEVVVYGKKATLEYVRIRNVYQLRLRDKKGHFVKIPKKYKND